MARVLGRIRLSRMTEESTSVGRQRELIQSWADNNGHEVVAWAEDVDVSGSVSPFDAPALGKFLTDDGAREWDILVAWKLDRLARNAINMNALFGWIQDNGKQLVCVSDNIDLSTWTGRLVANVIAGVAEGELEAITERVTAGKKALRESGRFTGGFVPFGYKVAPRQDGGKELVKDPETQEILQWIFQQALLNRPLSYIAADLNEVGGKWARRNHGPLKSKGWSSTTIRTILNNKAYLGWTMYQGKPVLDDNGEPVKRCEPSISIEDYNRIQELWSSRNTRVRKPKVTAPLNGVIECWECGQNMSLFRHKRETASAYRCLNHKPMIHLNAVVVEADIEEKFRDFIADLPILEKRVSVVRSSASELEQARATYKDIASYLPSAPDEETRRMLFQQLDAVSNRIRDLEASITTDDGTEWFNTGVTYGERWDQLDTEGRRLLLTSAGIRYRARTIVKGNRWASAVLESEILLPEELRMIHSAMPVDANAVLEDQQREFMAGLSEEHRQQIEAAQAKPTQDGEQ
nr:MULTISPECIES: recombinase family protein [Corynebacterium]